ncbi:MAG: translation initiation factor IF-2, partial [Bacteroidales bacterium]|nr:translation initiation factor IF-2 [Bacteroidales bacterium]
MSIRLNNVTRDLNVGIQTAVEFLQKKGYTIESNPNAKITDEQYAVLVKAFSNDKSLKEKSDIILQQRKEKKLATDEPKDAEEVKTEIPQNVMPKLKVVGSINLNNVEQKDTGSKEITTAQVGKSTKQQTKPEVIIEKTAAETVVERIATKSVADKESTQPKTTPPQKAEGEKEHTAEREEKPENTKEPTSGKTVILKQDKTTLVDKGTNSPSIKAKEKKEEKQKKETIVQQTLPQTKTAALQTEKKEEIFELRPTELKTKINVVGQIDLAALNQSTRPKKKTKEELKKERDDKEKQRAKQRQQMKEAIMKEISKTDTSTQNKP